MTAPPGLRRWPSDGALAPRLPLYECESSRRYIEPMKVVKEEEEEAKRRRLAETASEREEREETERKEREETERKKQEVKQRYEQHRAEQKRKHEQLTEDDLRRLRWKNEWENEHQDRKRWRGRAGQHWAYMLA